MRQQDIRQVVGEYVALSRNGTAHCPWPQQHKEGDQHKSFIVSERTQTWWCFTERVGGNAFDFLSVYHRLDARQTWARIRQRGIR